MRALFLGGAALQVIHLAIFLPGLQQRLDSPRELFALLEKTPVHEAVIFLADSATIVGKHLNRNSPDWRHADRIYLVDPGPTRRVAVTCAMGRATYAVATYDAARKQAKILDWGTLEPSACGAGSSADSGPLVR